MKDQTPVCDNCDDGGWVCEAHPDIPWDDGLGCCGGAGMPCECNKANPPWHYEPPNKRKDGQ